MRLHEELAWAAGFFDGEGCTVFKRANRHTKANVQMSITQKHPEVLERWVAAVGEGRLHGPYESRPGSPYAVQVFGAPRVRDVAEKLWPWLGSLKKKQIKRALQRLDEERDDYYRLKGPRCRRGHEDWVETKRGRVCRPCRTESNRESVERRSKPCGRGCGTMVRPGSRWCRECYHEVRRERMSGAA